MDSEVSPLPLHSQRFHRDFESEDFEQYLNGIEEGEFQEVAIDGDGGNMSCAESGDEINDDDYNLADSDEDFTETITQRKGKKVGGRTKKTDSSTMPSNFSILVPEVTNNYDSDFTSSEELKDTNVLSDGEEEETYVEYNEEKDKDNPSLELGMKFRSLKQFKEACRNWGIVNRYQVCFPTNDRNRVICVCYQEYLKQENKKKSKKQKKQKNDDGKGGVECPFKVSAGFVSKVDPTVQIKSINLTHTDGKVFENFHMNAEWLAKRYVKTFRADPEWSLNGLIERVKDDYCYTISRTKAWRAKDLARKWIYGEEGSQYMKLLSYRAELLKSNPGSTVIILRYGGKFLGFYVCLNALKEAFKSGCRPIVGLDGCWLKGNYGGNLLSAVAIDPNDCIFPIAYAVIAENESKETWTWFLANLGDDLEINNSHHITFMSDRQKGLIGAVRELFPNAEHRNCVRHMYQNFRNKHKGKELKDMVWSAACASNEVAFTKCMEKLENHDKDAREWFNHPDRPFNTWTRSMFRTNTRCDMLTNNLCESFNRYILDARDKAIITMLEMIKNQLMRRMCKKKEWIDRYQGILCPKIVKKLEKIRNGCTPFKPDFSGGPKVSVQGTGGPFIVDLVLGTCTCRKWELTGLPCAHAFVSILGNNMRVEDYVVSYYHVATYKNVYSHFINPTNPESHWPEVLGCGVVLPPKTVKQNKGRKPKSRKKEAEELEQQRKVHKETMAARREENVATGKLSKKGKIMATCSICKLAGHNARGHNKYVKKKAQIPTQGESSTIPNQRENDVNIWGYSKDYHHETWDNAFTNGDERMSFNFINQSAIVEDATQFIIEEAEVAADPEVCNDTDSLIFNDAGGCVEGSNVMKIFDGIDAGISKRGRSMKRKIMSDFITTDLKKKSRASRK